MKPPQVSSEAVRAQLGLWDGISIVIGIVVGVMIFKAPPLIFSNVAGPWQGLGAWVLGGVLSLIGALCYAELATTYPRTGGDYVYLTRAYGPFVGFLFGWAQLVAILTGSIGTVAFVFADYAVDFSHSRPEHAVWFAVAAVVALTVLNLFGVAPGKTAQNLLTAAKVVGLAAIIVAGLIWGGQHSLSAEGPVSGPGFSLAMILVLYAYGGWNDAAFVAAEVRDHRRNIPRVLLLGTGGVVVIYLLVNVAYLRGLGFAGLRGSNAPAADVLRPMLGDVGSKAISLIVMTSALGGVNGLIFAGSRVYATLGADYSIFGWLGRWNRKHDSPFWAICSQSAVALLMIVGVGTAAGRATIDGILLRLGFNGMPWERYHGGFDTLLAATAPVFWALFLLTGLSVFVLRFRDGDIERPFAVPLFPLTPILFCAMCVYMLYSSLNYAGELTLFALVPLVAGVPLFLLSGRRASGW